MIDFDLVQITPDSKSLTINVSVKKDLYYKDVYIDSVRVDTHDTYVSPYYPSENPIFQENIADDKNIKSYYVTLYPKDCNIANFNGIFYIYVITKGAPTEDTPCGKDNATSMKLAMNMYPHYQLAMLFIKELGLSCQIPSGLIDYILRLKALGIGVKTGNYTEVNKLWSMFFKNNKLTLKSKGGCGCGNSK